MRKADQGAQRERKEESVIESKREERTHEVRGPRFSPSLKLESRRSEGNGPEAKYEVRGLGKRNPDQYTIKMIS